MLSGIHLFYFRNGFISKVKQTKKMSSFYKAELKHRQPNIQIHGNVKMLNCYHGIIDIC